MKTSPDLALLYGIRLFESLEAQLRNPLSINDRLDEVRAHAPTFPEVQFCKGCVLPVVDAVTTAFFTSVLRRSRGEAHAALRCEGVTTLSTIYSPGPEQVGFSGYTWGTNWQRVDKTGRELPEGHSGYRPGPDFGIVHLGAEKFSVLGEVKFRPKDVRISLSDLIRDLKYYLGVPLEPDKSWHYEYGFGIAYAAGGSGMRRARLISEYWLSHRFLLAVFDGGNGA